MSEDLVDIGKWVVETNCFEVMGQLRRLEVISREDIKRAMRLSRSEWIAFMREKIGIPQEKNNESE
ncbi:hypothetical protein ACFLQK_02060 [bacterium]